MAINKECWVVIWVKPESAYPQMTSNIANEKVAKMIVKGYQENGYQILASCSVDNLIHRLAGFF